MFCLFENVNLEQTIFIQCKRVPARRHRRALCSAVRNSPKRSFIIQQRTTISSLDVSTFSSDILCYRYSIEWIKVNIKWFLLDFENYNALTGAFFSDVDSLSTTSSSCSNRECGGEMKDFHVFHAGKITLKTSQQFERAREQSPKNVIKGTIITKLFLLLMCSSFAWTLSKRKSRVLFWLASHHSVKRFEKKKFCYNIHWCYQSTFHH